LIENDVFNMDESDLDPFQLRMKKRFRSVKEMLKRCKKVDLKEFVAKVSINCGIHEKTIRRYLDMLENAGEIKIKDGIITLAEN